VATRPWTRHPTPGHHPHHQPQRPTSTRRLPRHGRASGTYTLNTIAG
jgi:hypothetical protein